MRATKQTEVFYFDDLPQTTREIVESLLIETIDEVEGWKPSDETIDTIECRSRDGFIPFSHNRGGLMARQFTDLMSLWGSGITVSHKKAQAEIERQIEYNLELAKETFFEKHTKELKKIGITEETDPRLNYHDLYKMKHGDLAERLSQLESKYLSDHDSSIMFEVRFMYSGCDETGTHRAFVSCAVNTEGPYHRPSISWAPGVFCEGAEETEIEWTTDTELRERLSKALQETSGEIF